MNIVEKQLADAPKHLQSLLMHLQKYDVTLKYVPGRYLLLPDTFSRAFLKSSKNRTLETILQVSFECVLDSTLGDVHHASATDDEVLSVRRYVEEGWPKSNHVVDPLAKPYYQYRDEIVIEDDLLCRGSCMIVSKSLRRTMLERTHSAHVGV